jgi:hypothetical protein
MANRSDDEVCPHLGRLRQLRMGPGQENWLRSKISRRRQSLASIVVPDQAPWLFERLEE